MKKESKKEERAEKKLGRIAYLAKEKKEGKSSTSKRKNNYK